MANRDEKVTLRIDFITDESQTFAKTILATKKFNDNIEEAKGKIKNYEKELAKASTTEARRAELLGKVAEQEKIVAQNLTEIAKDAQKVEKIDLGKLTPAQLTTRAKQLAQAMRDIPQSAPQFEILQKELSAVNGKLAEIKKTNSGIAPENGGGMGRLAFFAAKVGAVIGVVVAGAKGLLAALDKSAKFEQLNIAFSTFLGSAEKAKTVLADLKKFEVETPFDSEQVNNAGRALLAFGFGAEELIPTLRAVGDVAAGTGKDFNELALIYGKARAEGKIQNDTLNQLAEAGIPIYQELSKILGVSQDKIRKMAEDGKINFKELQLVFKNLSGEGGRFAGLMEKQSKSLDGLFSSLQSAITEKLVGALNFVLPAVKSITTGFLNLLSVPVIEKMEEERQAFNGLSVQIYNSNIGTNERTIAIQKLKEQYPEHLKNINAEKVTNEELKPVLDRINQSYIVRIALQKQQEKLQPLLEEQATTSERLAENRVTYNRELARGAELAKVNLAQYKTEAERIKAVEDGLRRIVDKQSVRFFASEESKALSAILQSQTLISSGKEYEATLTNKVADAEKKRQAVIEELRKSYGDLVDEATKATVAPTDNRSTGPTEADLKAAAKKRKELLDAEIKEVELATGREEIVLENARLKKEISQRVFDERLASLQIQGLEKQLGIYKIYGESQSSEAIKAESQILKIKQDSVDAAEKLADEATKFYIDGAEKAAKAQLDLEKLRVEAEKARQDQELEAVKTRLEIKDFEAKSEEDKLKLKFAKQVFLELDHDQQLARIKLTAADEKLKLLEENGLKETEIYRKTLDEKRAAESDYETAIIATEKRTLELRRAASDAALDISRDAISVGIELLGKDEAARKKHAGAIKAFEIGNIIVDSTKEIAGIWRNANSNPINALIPGWGTAFAIVQTAIAAARAKVAIGKVSAQKFARGVSKRFGLFGGQPHSAGGTRGYFEDGTVVEVEKDEPWIVLNKKTKPFLPFLSMLNERTGGVPLMASGGSLRFDTGGLTRLNTTPIASSAPPQLQQTTGPSPDLQMLLQETMALRQDLNEWQRSLSVKVVYSDIEAVGKTSSAIRAEAAL